jgi:formylglycine-generating enzyme required for sulfatase activity
LDERNNFNFFYFNLFFCFSVGCGTKKTEKSSAYEGMVLIPAGSFEMGDHFNEGDSDEKPVHTVQLSSFYMDKYEVTNGEYKKCVDAGSCRAPDESKSNTRSSYYGDSRYKNYPVIYVDWNQAKSYCEWKGGRLPTEAEWEYAARGGLEGARYPNGDNINCGDANFERWSGSYDDRKCRDSGGKDNDTHPVGSYAANGYGLYDMAGNVFEWVNDWYGENYYKNSRPRNPLGPVNGTSRVVRGGSWDSNTSLIRVSLRDNYNPTTWFYYLGFRCAR